MNFNYYIKYGIRYSLRYILKYIIRLIIFFSIIYLISFLSGKRLFISNVYAKEKEIVVTPETTGYGLDVTNHDSNIPLNTQFNFGGLYFYGGPANGSWKTLGAFYNIPTSGCYNVSITASFSGSTSFAPNSYSAFLRLLDNNSSIPFSNDGISPQHLPSGANFNNGGIYSAHKDNLCLSKGRYGFLWYMNGMSFYDGQYYGFGNMILTPVPTDDFVTEQKNTTNSINKTNDSINKTNDTIKDDKVDSSTNQGSTFFNDFDSGEEGNLSDIVSLPLEYVQHLNDTCQPFSIPLGNLGNFSIPCLSTIWSNTSFAGVINTASLIINGIICYKLLTSLFLFFKQLKDPDDDKVEVMDL